MSDRAKDEIYLIYNKTDERYYVYDGETYIYDVRGKARFPSAFYRFLNIVGEV